MCFLFMFLPPGVWKHCATLQGGTHSGGYRWYIFRRSCLVHIQAIMPGTHSGDHAWYILARSMTVMAVRRVTENRGKRTPGIDGIIWDTPHKKSAGVESLHQRGYHPQPLRRVY